MKCNGVLLDAIALRLRTATVFKVVRRGRKGDSLRYDWTTNPSADLSLESESTRTRNLSSTPTTEQLRLFASDRVHPVAPALGLRYHLTNGQDTETARQTRVESNPLDPEGSLRPSSPQRSLHAPSDMLPWAKENGWLIDVERIGLACEI